MAVLAGRRTQDEADARSARRRTSGRSPGAVRRARGSGEAALPAGATGDRGRGRDDGTRRRWRRPARLGDAVPRDAHAPGPPRASRSALRARPGVTWATGPHTSRLRGGARARAVVEARDAVGEGYPPRRT